MCFDCLRGHGLLHLYLLPDTTKNATVRCIYMIFLDVFRHEVFSGTRHFRGNPIKQCYHTV